ncbi:MAG: TIGR03905 family TSCPD domain-containing protein [Clostridia bacterium]|nr:TIGR03905 family TSCPD domain-containing protein [Clostridia bacterium]
MTYTYKTRGVCASTIEFELNDGIVSNVSFRGGCNGNLKAVSKLVEGMSGERVVEILKGNICGFKNTSCADQLAIAIEKALLEQGE